jgi:hypothetical protein
MIEARPGIFLDDIIFTTAKMRREACSANHNLREPETRLANRTKLALGVLCGSGWHAPRSVVDSSFY